MKNRKTLTILAAGLLSLSAVSFANDEASSLPKVERDGLEFYVYHVNHDESLYGISKRFDWDIDEIIAYNPEASGSLKKGFLLYYPTGRTINVSGRNSTDSNVSNETSLPELDKAKENNRISSVPETPVAQENEAVDGVPVTLPDSVLIEEHPEEPKILSRESNRPVDPERELRMILLVEEPASKRESEFAKGMLMALDAIKTNGKKVNLKIMQAAKDADDRVRIVEEVKDYEPELIFTTHEKDFPEYLLEYVNEGPAELVNVFDVKDDSFARNPGVVQMMTPSAAFSKDVASFAASRFRDRELIVIGNSDSADEVSSMMVEQWPGVTVDGITPEQLSEMAFDENKSYLLYVNVTRKNDISQILTIIGEKKQEYPLADISVFGRANWIVYADALNEKFFDADVYFPSRFYFETDSRRGKEFRSKFNELYNHQPVKSFPMYSVAGYDEATYFMNALRVNGGDWNRPAVGGATPLQAEIRLQPVENGGFVNPVCYVVRFAPFKMIDKMPLK